MAKWCIDAGHGGVDSGAVGRNGTKEKDIVLAAALEVKRQLELAGEKVVLTREDDRFVSLQDRCVIANSNNCDYFVSLHMNSASLESAIGTEIWVARERSANSDKLAETILPVVLDKVNTFGYSSPNRGKKVENFWVLRFTNMPAVLVEGDFISNPTVEDSFIAEEYGRAVAEGCLKFVGKVLGSSSIVNTVSYIAVPKLKITNLSPYEYSSWVSKLQSELNRQGFGVLNIDGYTGTKTLAVASTCPIYYGITGKITTLLQELLKELGYYTGNIDGSCGLKMVSAIKKWQSVDGLTIDGSFGPQCWKKLFDL